MESNFILQTHDLCKTYAGVDAVCNVNMHIEKGDIYGFVGENGAGKTTIIRLITGLARPTKGSFELFGVPNTDPKIGQAKSKTGGIVEAVSLSKTMTAMENLKLQCRICGIKKTDEELTALLEKVGLDTKAIAKKKAGQFSLGMRQRLGIATALLSKPEFILLDEPMNGLDPQGFIDMRETILRLHSEGVTFLISSHILSELEKICNKVGFISHGKLLEELSMEELHHKSRRKLVISSANKQELKSFLEKQFSNSSIEEENNDLVLYNEFDVNEVMKALVKNGIVIDSINVIEESIEDYYASLMIKEMKR